MGNKRSNTIEFILKCAVVVLGAALIWCGKQIELKESFLDSAEQEITQYEERLGYLEEREIELLGRLEAAEQDIEAKDALLLSFDYQPYELVPCFNCGNQVAIIEGEEKDCYYIKCTHCTVLFGPYATIGYAESEWNYIDE